MGHVKLSAIALVLALAASGMTIRPAMAAGELGNDLAGEACHQSGPAAPGQSADILCGAMTAPVGSLGLVMANALPPAGTATRRAAIVAAARTVSGSGLGAPDVMTCDGGQAEGDTLLFSCTLRSTAWPRLILVSATPRGVIAAEGLPTMMPVLAAAIASQSGAALSGADAVTAVVRAKYPSNLLKAGAADYAGYLQFVALGRLTASAGNFSGAEAAYRGALDIETRLFGPDSMAVGEALIELALEVSNQGRFDEAAALFRRATPIIESSTSAAVRARLASYRALDAANQRDYADALKYARDATTARRAEVDAATIASLDIGGNDAVRNRAVVPPALEGELAQGLRIEAEMAMRLGDLPGAQAAGEEALYIVTDQPTLPLPMRPQLVSLMGEVNDREGRVVIAERDFTDALAMDKKLFGDGMPTAMAQMRLGQFYSGQQLYPAALAAYRNAFALLVKDPVARTAIVADQIIPFLTAASASIGADAGERRRIEAEMFDASQLVDAGVADQTIARVAARQAASDPALAAQLRASDDAGRSEANLRMDLASERAKPDSERDAVREKALAEQLAAASAHSQDLRTKLQAGFPAYTRLSNPGTVTLAEFQKQLRPQEALASFVIGVRSAYILLATRDSLTVRPVNATVTSLSADIVDLRGAFVARLGRVPDFSLKSSYALYRQLLGPVEPQLAGIERLAIVSSSDLASLPFSLLVTADPQQSRNYTDAAWLIRRMAVVQVPSPRAFATLRAARPAKTPRPFLGVGNPSFTGSDGTTPGKALNALATVCQQGPADPALLRALPPLPETANEVRTVGGDLNASPDDILLGSQANEAALRAKPLDQYAVLYFATHGLLPGELQCQAEPGLVLSPPDTPVTTAAADGLLTASEIAGLNINAELVVLSACNTAAAGGTRFGGGALDGLADAFFDAGAHAVLASHWEVPSAETTRLMTGVFANLARDPAHDVAEALRQAQLALIAQPATAHPFDWAAFTLIGDGAHSGGGQS